MSGGIDGRTDEHRSRGFAEWLGRRSLPESIVSSVVFVSLLVAAVVVTVAHHNFTIPWILIVCCCAALLILNLISLIANLRDRSRTDRREEQ